MRQLLTVTTLGTSLLLMACTLNIPDRHGARVQQLQASLTVLEHHQVAAYRNQSWCKNVVYGRGRFSNNTEQSTCNLFLGPSLPFDAQADADFEQIAMQFSDANLLYITDMAYDDSGQLSHAQFHLADRPARSSYIYAPNYTTLPDNMANEVEYTAINDDWYYQWMDWN